MRRLQVERMGRVSYGPMLELQQQRHTAVLAGESEDTLFLLEHDPVVTLGKNSGAGNVLVSRDFLRHKGVELYATGRGGDVTYHGPGQLVGYPILALQEGEQDIKNYVFRLEEILIRAAADFGVEAERVPGMRGIWVGRDKIAAVGMRIARWVTMHGFAFNVSTDLSAFNLIVPCGIQDRGVTSLAKVLGQAPPLWEVELRIMHHAALVLQRPCHETAATPLPTLPPDFQFVDRVGAML